jgi:hypothetical protein
MGRTARLSKKVTIVIGAVIFGLLGLVIWQQQAPQDNKTNDVAQVQQAPSTDYVMYEGVDGKTALELLKQNTEVVTKSYDFGELVTSINGNDGGGQKYWTFYVDGKEAQVGAGTYVTKNGEKIEWRLQ